MHRRVLAPVTQAPTSPQSESGERLCSPAARAGGVLSAAAGTVSGLAPHLLHHIAPIAGAAIVTGAAGSVLFGAIGLALMVPMLMRLHRRFGSWLAPGIAPALFAVMFTVSTLWLGPAIRGDGGANQPSPHDGHDRSAVVEMRNQRA
jgi:hypothetical protein